MKRPSRYNTKQGEAILSYLASLDGEHVTASQIAMHFGAEDSSVGLTTVYRHLEKLSKDGKVRKYTMDDSSAACYQYAGESDNHDERFHLKCEICGALTHLQCDTLEQIKEHVYETHSFQINPSKTVFYGTCQNCFFK
jgi:Fur family ferric uptake transcriptional regulator